MDLEKHTAIFNNISLIYNLFFNSQVKKYSEIYQDLRTQLNLSDNSTILDIGCGTGAFSKTFSIEGHTLTGVDISEKMLLHAKKRGLNTIYGNIIEGLDFENKTFDHVISAYVTHGLDRDKRKQLLLEASRLSKGIVIFHDYSINSNPMIKFIEYLEDGDYFNFIKTGLTEMQEIFSNVQVIQVNKYNNWYICTP